MKDRPNLPFFDAGTGRQMRYVYEHKDRNYKYGGWIFYKDDLGEWRPLRKATDKDLDAINQGMSEAHHAGRKP